MDPFAHVASGALLGRAFRPTGERWATCTAFGVAAGLSPDIDAPIALLGPEAWVRWHHLYTHSLVGLVWVPLALSLLPLRFAPWRTRFALALAGWALHVTLDVVGRWPVPVLWPLSQTRWALYRLDRDFSLTLDLLLIVGLAATLWDPAQRHARPIAIGTGLVLCFWLAAGLPT